MRDSQPIFNVPGPVLLLLGLILGVHAVRQFLDPATELWWFVAMAFIPARYGGQAADIPGGGVAAVTSFFTHIFLHADALHLTINSAWFLAFGSVLSKRIGWMRFYAFTFASGIAGALLFLAFNPGLMAIVIGASGAIAGLMGAVMRFLFSAIDRREGWLLRENPSAIPLMSVTVALRDRRILVAGVMFVALNLLALAGAGMLGSSDPIAWEAHLGGYFFGMLAFGFFDGAAQRELPRAQDDPTNVA
ncbi:MAG: rhomboid family intramembrane serine protease [Hyphomicrobium sp.]